MVGTIMADPRSIPPEHTPRSSPAVPAPPSETVPGRGSDISAPPTTVLSDKEPSLKWQDGLAILGVILALGGMSEMPLAFRVLLFVAGAISMSVSFWIHEKWPRPMRLGSIIGINILMALVIYWVIAKDSEHPITAGDIAHAWVEEDNKKTAVEIECNTDSLPIHVAPNDTGHLVFMDGKLITGQPGGLFDVPNMSEKPTTWPDKRLLVESASKHNPGSFIYRCVVSNEGRTKLLNVSLGFNLNFDDTKQTFPYQVIVNPLDPAQKFTFYFVNICPTGASSIIQTRFTAQILGENDRRSYRLLLPNRSPMQQFMIFFPSSVNWVGDACA
jgi:hypothetical protein